MHISHLALREFLSKPFQLELRSIANLCCGACAMAPPHPLLVHFGCVRFLLQKSVGKGHEHTMASQIQKVAMVDRVKKANLHDIDPETRAKICNMLQRCAFMEADKVEIMQLLVPPAPKERAHRLPMQRFFPMILEYFTEQEWARMSQPNLPTAMEMLQQRIVALGGRNPSEKCSASLTSLILHVCSMGKMNMDGKQQVLTLFKTEFKRKVRNLPPVRPYFADLPSPEALQHNHPALFHSLFGASSPTSSKVDLSAVSLPVVTCRVNAKHTQELLALEDRSRASDSVLPMEILRRVVSMQQDAVDLMRSNSNPMFRPLAALVEQSSHSSMPAPGAPPPDMALRMPSLYQQVAPLPLPAAFLPLAAAAVAEAPPAAATEEDSAQDSMGVRTTEHPAQVQSVPAAEMQSVPAAATVAEAPPAAIGEEDPAQGSHPKDEVSCLATEHTSRDDSLEQAQVLVIGEASVTEARLAEVQQPAAEMQSVPAAAAVAEKPQAAIGEEDPAQGSMAVRTTEHPAASPFFAAHFHPIFATQSLAPATATSSIAAAVSTALPAPSAATSTTAAAPSLTASTAATASTTPETISVAAKILSDAAKRKEEIHRSGRGWITSGLGKLIVLACRREAQRDSFTPAMKTWRPHDSRPMLTSECRKHMWSET